ncbi:Dihydrolipoyllysine-residue succinyltransferase component of 2-oxoglutarate dehydrogenase complex [Luteitalea pratensis]|uniref:Dihydrolipoyllysine-residue succinyltransferase component of 2-oxoglutarate dehydrogenase complex n=1 Tax=Luteitalea pratensis TaxID=1855912 RepID=A0A143PNW1_LUTPR|nr:2-oxoglutarate dehydrogenase complex dihydrolipoyllysine-residue succinyltransferase [Luteitalea pratensis]AMY10347.1 Dihydrolipoyllysine-residue succinyltransferase component of 2-oxoglutarate dehydrogenase complex [Luteitalea pratensis]
MAAQVVVPQLGESVVEARVARWLKKEGEAIAVGDPLVELETEKIDLEVNADQAGVLAKILRQEGEDVKVGEQLALIEAGTGAAAAPASAQSDAPAHATPAPPEAITPAVAAAPAGAADGPRSTPAARKAAEMHQVDMAQVQGSGNAGRVMRRDVEAAATQAAPASPAAPAPAAARSAPAPVAPPRPAIAPGSRTEERVRMSKRRLTIARNLVEAQRTAAMLTTFNEVDMTELMGLRERRKEQFAKRHGVGIGIASFFVKAAVAALKAFPRLNAEIQGEEMVLKHYYDVGIAVGAEQGLVVPVIRSAEQLSFAGIELAIRDFAARAKSNTLTLEDLKGGSFTITNGGVFGSLLSTPILNPPQVGILGLHKIEDRPVAIKGQVVVRPMMYLALSYDHRIVDGLEAVQFLVKVKEYIEDPGHLLLES